MKATAKRVTAKNTAVKKVIIAPDSFKESLSAVEVAEAIEDGLRSVWDSHPSYTVNYIKAPMADGGEGTVHAMIEATQGQLMRTIVTGPLGAPVDASWGMLGDGDTAVIEMAAASGLALVPASERDPMRTTSFGTGELILAALAQGARKIIIGIGGSATNDAGAGMLQALGARLMDARGEPIAQGASGLRDLDRIELATLDTRLHHTDILVACDVNNPLCGPKGASYVFGAQKGATPKMLPTLDALLARFADHVHHVVPEDRRNEAGAGAAGGMGFALRTCVGASMRAGVDVVMEAIGLQALLQDADLVITGEGRMDAQSIHGKTAIGVARAAKANGTAKIHGATKTHGVTRPNTVPVIAICGSLGPDYETVFQHGIDAAFAIIPEPCSLTHALRDTRANLHHTARNIAALFTVVS